MMEQVGKGNVALLCMNVQKERTFLLFYNFFSCFLQNCRYSFQYEEENQPCDCQENQCFIKKKE